MVHDYQTSRNDNQLDLKEIDSNNTSSAPKLKQLNRVSIPSMNRLYQTRTNGSMDKMQKEIDSQIPRNRFEEENSSVFIRSSLAQLDSLQIEVQQPRVAIDRGWIVENKDFSTNVDSNQLFDVALHLTTPASSSLWIPPNPIVSHDHYQARFNFSLSPLASYIPSPSFLSSHPSNPCSSCGVIPSSSSSIFNQTFVILPCQHLLCPVCLNTLVNSTANEPPRKPNCFACPSGNEVILDFQAVKFDYNLSSNDFESNDGELSSGNEEGGGKIEWKTPTKSKVEKKKLNLSSRLENLLLGELSPVRNLIWSDEPMSSGKSGSSVSSTPGTTPESSRSYGLKTDGEKEIPKPRNWNVVRVDNIPWDLQTHSVESWLESCSIPQISKAVQILSIHILCNRGDGRTLNQLFIELPTLAAAQKLVRSKNGKKIVGRTVSVVLTSQEELMRHVFPAWSPGFDGLEAINPAYEGVIISNDDLDGLAELCEIGIREKNFDAFKAPERPFLQIATILTKFPFHQPEVYTMKLSARLFMTVEDTLGFLFDNEKRFEPSKTFERVVEILLKTALACPVFRGSQKSKLLSLVGLSPLEIKLVEKPISSNIPSTTTTLITPPSSPCYPKSHLRSPTLDRVKNTLDSSPLITPLNYGLLGNRGSSTSTSRGWNEVKPTREPISPTGSTGFSKGIWRRPVGEEKK